MTDLLILGGAAGIIVIVAWLDRLMWRTWLTPAILLGVPYIVIVVAAAMTAPSLGFVPLYVESVVYWMAGFLVFWTGGLIVRSRTGPLVSGRVIHEELSSRERDAIPVALVLAWGVIALLVLAFRGSLEAVGGLAELGTQEFEQIYGYGPSGHVLTFLVVLLMFLVGVFRRGNLLLTITIVAGFLLVLAGQIKTWIFIPLLGGVLYRAYRGRLNLTLLKVLAFAGMVAVLFFGAYLIGIVAYSPAVLLDGEAYTFLARHFISYLYSGVLTFGEMVRTGFPDLQHDAGLRIFAWIVNMWRMFTGGEFVSFIDPNLTLVDMQGLYTSNVHTLFGALLGYLGWGGALLYSLILGLVTHLLFFNLRRSVNPWMMVIWCYLAATLFFGWFDLYFWHVAVVVEVPAYCLVLAGFSALSRRERAPKTDVAPTAMRAGGSRWA